MCTKRLCEVNGQIGYFHGIEQYSNPVEPSPFVGGHPGGVISYCRAIVEFPGKVEYVGVTDVRFIDKESALLSLINECWDVLTSENTNNEVKSNLINEKRLQEIYNIRSAESLQEFSALAKVLFGD